MSFFKFVKEINKKVSLKQFFKFSIVGVSNTIIGLAVYYCLIYLNINYVIANTMGFIISVLNAYYWNSKYVFGNIENRYFMNPIIKVIISYGLTYLVNTGFLLLTIEFFNISKYVGPIIILFITTPINFLLNKYWAFK